MGGLTFGGKNPKKSRDFFEGVLKTTLFSDRRATRRKRPKAVDFLVFEEEK